MCAVCEGGKYAEVTASTACTCVAAGHKPTADHKAREACAAGTHSSAGVDPVTKAGLTCSSTCSACTDGKFSNTTGHAECVCSQAGSAPNTAKTDEVACTAGTYAASTVRSAQPRIFIITLDSRYSTESF